LYASSRTLKWERATDRNCRVSSQRTALVDPRANRWSFSNDNAGRERFRLDPLSRRTSFSYDANGRQTLRIDGRSFRTTYVYDDLDRLTGRRYPDASRVTLAYDAVGNRTKSHDPTGRYTTTFDELNRSRTVKNPAGKTLTYAYDAVSQRRFLIEPEGGRFTTSYDDARRIRLLVNPQGDRTSWTYDAASQVSVQRLANGARCSYTYDDAGKVTFLGNYKSDGTAISSFADAWDASGNRTSRVEADGNRVTWSYDNTYQLTRERRSGANSYDVTYSYDASGNRRVKINGGSRTTCGYDSADQLRYHQDGGGRTTYTFDASGNQQLELAPNGDRTTNTWDFENRRTLAVLPSAVRNTFAYQSDGLRVQSQDSGGTTKHVWDGQNVLLETDGADATGVVYSLEPVQFGNLISQRRSGATKTYHFDPLGSTDRLTASDQTVTDSYLYQAFGEILASSGSTTNPWRYGGRLGYYLQTDLAENYVRARWNDPAFGRWLSQDPQYLAGILPLLYAYVGNGPVVQIDPSGLQLARYTTMLPSARTGAYAFASVSQPLAIPPASITPAPSLPTPLVPPGTGSTPPAVPPRPPFAPLEPFATIPCALYIARVNIPTGSSITADDVTLHTIVEVGRFPRRNECNYRCRHFASLNENTRTLTVSVEEQSRKEYTVGCPTGWRCAHRGEPQFLRTPIPIGRSWFVHHYIEVSKTPLLGCACIYRVQLRGASVSAIRMAGTCERATDV
jgi:RHS repeat-associated protein